MSDAQDTQEQEHTGHVWYFRLRRDAEPEQVEFPTALNKQDASNRIASMLGVKELDRETVVSHRRLEKLAPVQEVSRERTRDDDANSADNISGASKLRKTGNG